MTAHQKSSEQVILLLYLTENTISSLKFYVSNGDVKEFSGKGECKSADGSPSFCCFAQPFVVCFEEKTLFVIDRPTLIVRIITSLKPLINYLMILQSISKTFGIHYKNLGFDNAETLRDAIGTLKAPYSTRKNGAGCQVKSK